MSGTQIPVQSRQYRPRTHDAVHLPQPLIITASGSFSMAMKDALKDKARRALYATLRENDQNIELTIPIWL